MQALDALGDLMLGGHIMGAYSSVKPGHAINHALLAKLFSCPTNYEIVK
jgi:UDP-3-O-[3-hydroxymyristoyl] N-acetylglucosamine deacetylase